MRDRESTEEEGEEKENPSFQFWKLKHETQIRGKTLFK